MTHIHIRKEWLDIPDELEPGEDGRLVWRMRQLRGMQPPDDATVACIRRMLANAKDLGLTPWLIASLERTVALAEPAKPPAVQGGPA
jgi:hypothetical protein